MGSQRVRSSTRRLRTPPEPTFVDLLVSPVPSSDRRVDISGMRDNAALARVPARVKGEGVEERSSTSKSGRRTKLRVSTASKRGEGGIDPIRAASSMAPRSTTRKTRGRARSFS